MRTILRWSLPLVLLAGVANAQERQVERQPAPPTPPGTRVTERAPTERGAAVSMRDRELAHCIINGNRKEVEISKFALDKLQDAEVKQFAQKMIDDHSRAMQSFARFDPGSRATIQTSTSATEDREIRTSTTTERNTQTDRNPNTPGDRDRNPQNRENNRDDNDNRTGTQPNATTQGARTTTQQTDRDRPAATGTTTQRQVTTSTEVGGVAKANLDWEQISDELTAQCIASAKRELGQKQGAEFEKAFLGMQVAAHMGMLDHLQVFQRHAGDELRAEIGKAVSTTQEHLQMAKRLMDEKKDTPSGARSTENQNRDASRPANPATPSTTERRDDATP